MWRWNIDQIKARLDLFNGLRVFGIVHDGRSEDPSIVQSCLEGQGCEFLVSTNDPSGEVVTFSKMLRRVASTCPNEVTFYGHAKGVSHEPFVPASVRRWAQVNYATTLDDWVSVREQLERFALTGSFRAFGHYREHRNLSDWHYSGTFFWLRHSRVFAKDCFEVPAFYGGVEIWPGRHFSRDEVGCLQFDNFNLRESAYGEALWQSSEEEIAHWWSNRRVIQAPSDLVEPAGFEGIKWPRLEQRPDEFAWFMEQLARVRSNNILTIGAKHGGMEWHIARRFRQLGRDIEITAVELNSTPELLESLKDARSRFGQQISLIEGDSNSPQTRAKLRSHYDAVFIDSDHRYRNCRSDFEFALSTQPQIIGLHDIVDSDWHAQARCSVSKLWTELRARYSCEEMMAGEWGGIGVVRPLGL